MNVDVESGVVIKSCPLCGSEAKLRSDQGDASVHFWVKCQNGECGISPAASKSADEAVANWNRRA